MVFAFAYGNLSGAHFNPAVTVGVLAARAMSIGEAIAYIIGQLVAATCAAFLLRAVLGGVATGLGRPELAQNVVLGTTTLTITPEAGFVIEAVLAFFLVIVVLTTAYARSAGNLAPIAIGMTVALNIMMAGSLTGANFNPAISLGPMIATANFTNAWLYVIAPIVGALAAALIHKVLKLLAEDGTMAVRRATTAAE
jgi:MIP family channel proteins